MGKRHQQNPGADFTKKKRKVGKGKPTPDNSTKTSFVSRGIVVPAQLGNKDGSVPTTKRKLSFTELLSQLNHHNANFRHDALNGLRELFISHPDVLATNVSTVLEKISPIFTDSNSSVRQALSLLFKHIINKVPKDNLTSFFPRIVTCIMCAMTHIDNSIQLDSLRFLNPLLMSFSALLINHAPKLQNYCLCLLSSQASVVDITKDSSTTFKLESGGTGKLVPMKTRMEIFVQLSLLLKASINYYEAQKDTDISAQRCAPLFNVVNKKATIPEFFSDCNLNFFDLSGPIPHVKLFKNWGISPPDNAYLKDSPLKNVGNQQHLFSSFVTKLLPILLECWMETKPMNMLTGIFNSAELTVRMIIVKLLLYVVRLSYILTGENGISQFRDSYSGQIRRCFLTYFPLNNSSKSDNLFLMNLYLCETFVIMYGGVIGLFDNMFTSLLNFFDLSIPIESCVFASNPDVINECVTCFTRCLKFMISLDVKSPAVTSLLNGGVGLYNNCHAQSQAKKSLIKLFYEMLIMIEKMGIKSESNSIYAVIVPWLDGLPQLLKHLGCSSPSTSSLILEVLVHAAASKLLPSLDKQTEELFDEPLVFSAWSEELQRKAVTLVWHMDLLSSHVLKLVVHLILKDVLQSDIAVYLIQVVHERLHREYRSANSQLKDAQSDGASDYDPLYIVSLYVSFMWSITVGFVADSLDIIGSSNTTVSIVEDTPTSGYEIIVQCACKCMLASDYSDQVWDLMSSKLKHFVTSKCIPMSGALRVMQFVRGINRALPLSQSSTSLQVISTLVLRVLSYTSTAESSSAYKLTLDVLLDINQLLSSILQDVTASLKSGEGEGLHFVLIKLLQEPKLAHSFHRHRGMLSSIASIGGTSKVDQWQSDLEAEIERFCQYQQ